MCFSKFKLLNYFNKIFNGRLDVLPWVWFFEWIAWVNGILRISLRFFFHIIMWIGFYGVRGYVVTLNDGLSGIKKVMEIKACSYLGVDLE